MLSKQCNESVKFKTIMLQYKPVSKGWHGWYRGFRVLGNAGILSFDITIQRTRSTNARNYGATIRFINYGSTSTSKFQLIDRCDDYTVNSIYSSLQKVRAVGYGDGYLYFEFLIDTNDRSVGVDEQDYYGITISNLVASNQTNEILSNIKYYEGNNTTIVPDEPVDARYCIEFDILHEADPYSQALRSYRLDEQVVYNDINSWYTMFEYDYSKDLDEYTFMSFIMSVPCSYSSSNLYQVVLGSSPGDKLLTASRCQIYKVHFISAVAGITNTFGIKIDQDNKKVYLLFKRVNFSLGYITILNMTSENVTVSLRYYITKTNYSAEDLDKVWLFSLDN